MDKGIRLQKEIAMGIASKKETNRNSKVKVQNKKCGGMAMPGKKMMAKGGKK